MKKIFSLLSTLFLLSAILAGCAEQSETSFGSSKESNSSISLAESTVYSIEIPSETESALQESSKPTSASPTENETITLEDFYRSYAYIGLQYDVYHFVCAYIHADREDALQYMYNESVLTTLSEKSHTVDALTSYAYTAIKIEPYELDGVQTQKAEITVRYAFDEDASGTDLSMQLVMMNEEEAVYKNWKILGYDSAPVPANVVNDETLRLPLTLESFCTAPQYISMQNTVFRFVRSYVQADRETYQSLLLGKNEFSAPFSTKANSMEEYNAFVYDNVGVESYDLDGVQTERAFVSVEYTFPENESTYYLSLDLVRVDVGNSAYEEPTWKVIFHDFEPA